jgi:FlaG/FlaF family flagellin (archaellin)
MSRFSIVLAICSIVSFTFAQSEPAKSPPSKQTSAPVEPAPVKAKAIEQGVEKVLAGVIANVNKEKKTVSIKVKSGDYAVSFDEKTILRAGEKQITFADLKPGDWVHIDYLKISDGERKAVKVDDKTLKTKPETTLRPEAKKDATAPKAESASPKAEPAPAKAEAKPGAAVGPKPEATAQPAVKAKDTTHVKKD